MHTFDIISINNKKYHSKGQFLITDTSITIVCPLYGHMFRHWYENVIALEEISFYKEVNFKESYIIGGSGYFKIIGANESEGKLILKR